ncbi:hypothetical protein [Streptomyces sp. CAU 1734]|uniref:hypothetical protein n=1 Tax=Streptomyces sp. CAU 1734 TaxID=3140360 RepID=UPI0032618109
MASDDVLAPTPRQPGPGRAGCGWSSLRSARALFIGEDVGCCAHRTVVSPL